jgi:hypothetical protein
MMRLLRAAPLAPALLLMNSCIYIDMGDFSHFTRDFHYSFPLKPGGHISVEGFNGSVEITPWDEATVDINGTKHAPSESQADAFRIDISHTDSMVSIHAARQYDWHGNYGVKFSIKVPRGAVVDRVVTSNGSIHTLEAVGPSRMKSSNGAIRAEKFKGEMDAQTSNGPIELDQVAGAFMLRTSNGHIHADDVRGALDAQTSNSAIKASLLRVDREVRAETHNGAIELSLPASLTSGVHAGTNNSSITVRLAEPVNVQISAHTSNSSVTSDFDTRMHGDLRRNGLEGSIGNGGPLIDLSTSNGSIKILKN